MMSNKRLNSGKVSFLINETETLLSLSGLLLRIYSFIGIYFCFPSGLVALCGLDFMMKLKYQCFIVQLYLFLLGLEKLHQISIST
jgi:hypothetical protein